VSNSTRQIVRLLLIADVLICPFWCPARAFSAGGCNARSVQSTPQRHACCPACDPIDDLPSAPTDPDKRPPCQCFCSKAIVGKLADDVSIDPLAGFVAALAPAVLVAIAPPAVDAHADPSSDFASSGRELRCLYVSFLC